LAAKPDESPSTRFSNPKRKPPLSPLKNSKNFLRSSKRHTWLTAEKERGRMPQTAAPHKPAGKGRKQVLKPNKPNCPPKLHQDPGGSTKFKSEEKSPPKTATAETTLPLDQSGLPNVESRGRQKIFQLDSDHRKSHR